MQQQISFENHFAARVMEIHFPNGFVLRNAEDLEQLKASWRANLKSWHSPYTCLFDLRAFSLKPDMQQDFQRLIRFFEQFFMRKIVGFTAGSDLPFDVPFAVEKSYESGLTAVGLSSSGRLLRSTEDLRGRISIDNDFSAHVMEIHFLSDVDFATASDVDILRSKLKNILRMWHTPYSILINCVNCTFSPEAFLEFQKLERFLKGFFCQRILGFAPKVEKSTYPFEVVRSRHLAAGQLEHQGLQSGSKANCASRKV